MPTGPEQLNLPDEELEYYQNYFTRIESLFAALRGRAILLSPNDYQLAKSWYEKGIPLACVLRGIREAFYKKLADEEYEEDAILSLSWCRWAVMAEWKQHKRSHTMPEEREVYSGEVSSDQRKQIIESFVFDLRLSQERLDDSHNDLRELLESAAVELGGLADSAAENDETEGILTLLSTKLRRELWEQAPEKRKKKIETSVRRSLKKHQQGMEAAVYAETLLSACQSRLAADLGVPVFSLHTV